jgi:RimJ/RimL family protein N-acetyltransferase
MPGYLEAISKDSRAEKSQQAIGPPVFLPLPAQRPSRVTLPGKTVTIKPLTPSHAPDLYHIVEGEANEHLFTYLFDQPYPSLDSFQEAVTAKSRSEDPMFFAIEDNATSTAVGWASLMRIDATHRVLEVGNILFSPRLQRTKAATEAMYLLARYVFEDLKYRRYEWKCDNLNGPSKRAAVRFGFAFEGVFRKHMVYKGRNRDTCWFAMVDEDWNGGVKRGFDGWLDEGNFDAQGGQLRRLEDIRGGMDGLKGPVVLEV